MRRSLLTAGFSLTALALAGCMTVGPDYTRPATADATLLNADPAHFRGDAIERAWWQQFHDPVLSQLVDVSLARNHDLRIASANLKAARAVFDDVELDRLPTVTAEASHQHGKAQQPGLGEARQELESYRAGFDMSWEIDLFGHVERSIEAAEADAQAAEAALRAAKVSVIAEVARSYGELRGAQTRLSVAMRNRDNQAQTLSVISARREAGRVTDLEVATARARLAGTEARIPPLSAAVKRAEYRLAVLAGYRPGELPVDLAVRPLPDSETRIAIGQASELLRRRPDVAQAERQLAGATARVGVATADLFPRLSVTGFLGFVAGTGSALGESGSKAWSVAPTLSWPAFDLGSVRARLRASEAGADAALAGYEQTVLRALEETENAFVAYGEDQRRLGALSEQVQANAQAVELARVRYEEGVVDFLVLLDSERDQLNAEEALAEAQTSSYTGIVAIYKALGGGWEAEADTGTTTAGNSVASAEPFTL